MTRSPGTRWRSPTAHCATRPSCTPDASRAPGHVREDRQPAQLDARGRLRLVEFGEGDYAGKERAIRALLAEAGASALGSHVSASGQTVSTAVSTPESYLGAARAQRFVNGPITPGIHNFGAPRTPPSSELDYGGADR